MKLNPNWKTTSHKRPAVLVVCLKLAAHGQQFPEDVWHDFFQGRQVAPMGIASSDGEFLWSSNAGDHIFTLGIDQKFPVELVFTGGWIAGESHSGGTVVALVWLWQTVIQLPPMSCCNCPPKFRIWCHPVTHITKDHGLDIHGRPPPLRDVMQCPVGLGPLIHPGIEDGPNGAPKLSLGILREFLAQLQLHHLRP